MKCPEHGVKTVALPWAEKSSRFAILFERFAIDVLSATETVSGAMSILRTSWGQTWHFVQRAVRRGFDRKEIKSLPRIGINEKAFAKGQNKENSKTAIFFYRGGTSSPLKKQQNMNPTCKLGRKRREIDTAILSLAFRVTISTGF